MSSPSEASPAIRGVVAVQNYGVSGSTLMQSLLDDHPEILSLPGLYALPLYPFYERHGHLPFPEVMRLFFEQHGFWFDRERALTDMNSVGLGLHQLGPNRDQPATVDMMEFLEAMESHYAPHADLPPEERRGHFITGVFLAWHAARAQKKPLPGRVWLCYPIHALPLHYAQQMRADFAECRFLHTVRHPLRDLGSTMRLTATKEDWWMFDGLQRALAQILNDQQMFAEIHRAYGYRPYFADAPAVAVRLEDMHAHSKAVMEAVARWLGVAWSESLLESTFAGLAWWNRPESKRVSGFDSSIASRDFSEFVTARDRFLLAPLLRRQYRAWGYDTPASLLRLLLHAPLLLLPLSQEAPSPSMRRRYDAWLAERKEAPSPRAWRRYRRLQYAKCRRWLFMAWWSSLKNDEPMVQLLSFARS